MTDPASLLQRDDLVPPPAPESIGNGATADLRGAMARFRTGSAHALARSDVERLGRQFPEVDRVAALSLLYQNHDAAAALIGVILHASLTDGEPLPPLERTLRISTESGELVEVNLRATPYGAGDHACPGRAIAEAISHAVVTAVQESTYTLATDGIDLDANGRPHSIRMEHPNERNV